MRNDQLTLRLQALDAELPQLAALCAEITFWRGHPDSGCTYALAYRDALLEHEALRASLVAA